MTVRNLKWIAPGLILAALGVVLVGEAWSDAGEKHDHAVKAACCNSPTGCKTVKPPAKTAAAACFGSPTCGKAGQCPAKAAAKKGGGCPRCAMNKQQAPHMAELAAALKAAKAAADTGDTKIASAKITHAQGLLASMQQQVSRCPGCEAKKKAAAQVTNTRCPIMGRPVDPANVPANLTREHKGRRVGFCCSGCPAAWDKLTETQKESRLAAAITP